jgi:hypothetical protein
MICVLDLTDREKCRITTGESLESGFVLPLSLGWGPADQNDNVWLAIDSKPESTVRFRLDSSYMEPEALHMVTDLWFRLAFSNLPDITTVTEFIFVYPSGVHWENFLQFVEKIAATHPESSIILISGFAAAMMALIHDHSETSAEHPSAKRESAILLFPHDTCLADITFMKDSNELLSIRVSKILNLPMALTALNAITLEIEMFLEFNSGRDAGDIPAIYGFCERDVVQKRLRLLKTAKAFKSISLPDAVFPNACANSLISQRRSSRGVAVYLPERDLYIRIGSQRSISLTCRENRSAHCWKRRIHFSLHPESDIPFKLSFAIPGSLHLDATVIASGLLPPWCLGEKTIITSKQTAENAFEVSIESEEDGRTFHLSALPGTQASIVQHKSFFQEIKT